MSSARNVRSQESMHRAERLDTVETSPPLDEAVLRALERSLSRSGTDGSPESYRTPHLRDACGAIASEIRKLRARLEQRRAARGGLSPSDAASVRAAADAFVEASSKTARDALAHSRQDLSEMADPGGRGSEPSLAVQERLDRYGPLLDRWSPEDWLGEYEQAVRLEDQASAQALEQLIDTRLYHAERVAAKSRRLRRADAYGGGGSPAEIPLGTAPVSRRGVARIRRRYEKIRAERLGHGPAACRRRLETETNRFRRFIERRLPFALLAGAAARPDTPDRTGTTSPTVCESPRA